MDVEIEDEQDEKAGEELLKLEQLRGDIQTCFGSPQGERVLEWLYSECHQNRPTFVRDDPGGRYTAYREGSRRVWLAIMEHMLIDDIEIINRARNRALRG